MSEVWHMTLVLLMIGILSGLIGMSSPTTAMVINMPPQWDFHTVDFSADSEMSLDLTSAFFDPDGDSLAFSVSPSENVSAGVDGDVLVIFEDSNGELTITASDGINMVSQTISVRT